MTVMIDALAERYGLLPSEVIARADTYDLYVMDVAMSYANHRNAKAEGRAPDYTTEELQAMMEATRGKTQNTSQ